MKNKCLCFLLGVLSTVLVVSGINFFTSYERNVDNMLYTAICYKDATVFTSLSSDGCVYLTHGKRALYFGKLPENVDAIEINSPGRAILYVYPNSDDSLIVRYKPYMGISRNYKISEFGDFNKYLEILYELTGNEVFNETVEYEE